VKRGLDALGVPYRHLYLSRQAEVAPLYHALDLYLIASRQEGGPKALLEAMASGVPVVTTRVGQAMDLVRHGENGWLVEIEDAEGLAYWAERALADRTATQAVVRAARQTAEANAYTAQTPLWERFMRGFVSW
jgi:glycosyltransferase involved in cell wall biosynthesis